MVKYRRLGSVTEVAVLCKSPRKVKKCLRDLNLKDFEQTFEWIKVIDTKKCTNNKEKLVA